jgi:neutral ceramidase
MNQLPKRILLWLTVVLSVSVAESAEISAGFAQVDITPPLGGQTTGYSNAPVTDGIHDPVIAQIVILKTAEQSIAVAVCDLCIFNSPWLHQEVRALGFDHFLLANTHTHAGPSMRQDDFPSPEKPWRRTVEERILAAVAEAQKNLFPAHFAVSTGELQLGYNRLVRQPEGHAVTHFDNPERIPYGPVDPTVTVMRLTDDRDAVRLVLVAYACHPVVLGPRNSKISAGYPGVLRAMIEDGVGNDAKCVFLQGGAGDINPLMIPRSKEPQEDFAFVKTMGTLLGDKVLAILDRMNAVKGRSDSLDIRSKIIEVDHRFIAQNSVTLGVSSLLINGEVGIVTMPGEPFHLFQEYLRDRAALPHTLFLGYCSNGGYPWPSYVPDLMSAARGGYGASDTTDAAVGTGERLLNLGVSQLYQMRGMLKDRPQRHIFDQSEAK